MNHLSTNDCLPPCSTALSSKQIPWTRLSIALAASALLAACGGGGSSDTAAQSEAAVAPNTEASSPTTVPPQTPSTELPPPNATPTPAPAASAPPPAATPTPTSPPSSTPAAPAPTASAVAPPTPAPAASTPVTSTPQTPTPTPTTPTATPYTFVQIDGCPNIETSPLNLSQLGCVVGRYQGTVKDDPQHAACTVSIQSNGQVTVGIDGKTLTHQVPPKPEDANANGFKTSFGFYASHTRAFYELRSEGPNASGVTQKFDITLQQSSAQDSVPAYHAEATISGSTHACTADIALPPVNAAQFNACPKTQITDLTLEKYSNQLHCLSGVYRGTLLNAQGAPTAEACDIMLQPRGWVSLFTDHAETSSTFELVAMDDYFEVDAAYDGRPNGNTVSSLFTHHLNGMDTRFNAVLTQTPSGLALESHLMRNDGAYTVDGKNTDLSCRSAVIK